MKQFYPFILFTLILIFSPKVKGQDNVLDTDSISVLGGNASAMDSLNNDPNKVIEDAALDIGQNRGLFILTPDGKMQMRILGSVRYLLVYDQYNLATKNSLLTFEIPTNNILRGPANYYNELSQSRLGFEITRHTPTGNVFVRLEADFAGSNGFRIRHAYGQYGKFIFGQTWSLFSHITSLAATVDFSGPTGATVKRTPQIRYSLQDLTPSLNLSAALEYFKPEVSSSDTLGASIFQLVPDLSVRLLYKKDWGDIQYTMLVPTITAEISNGDIFIINGYGLSLSGNIRMNNKQKWYFQVAGGKGIARFFSDLSGRNLDLVVDPFQNSVLPFSGGAYLTFEHRWTKDIYSNITGGVVFLEQYYFYDPSEFYNGGSIHFNTFWDIVDGARFGFEYVYGYRVDKDLDRGDANRFNAMIYYDF